MQPVVAENRADVLEMPKILPERAANHAVCFSAFNHDPGDDGRIRPDDCFRQFRRHAVSIHDLMVPCPVLAIPWIIVGIHDIEVHVCLY